MKKITSIAIIVGAIITPTLASADGHRWREPPRVEHREGRGGINPWPFIAGAVVGGILVNAAQADDSPRVISSRASDAPVLVNGVWMQRVRNCVQEIVTDRYGNESIVNRCNYIYVPVQVQTP